MICLICGGKHANGKHNVRINWKALAKYWMSEARMTESEKRTREYYQLQATKKLMSPMFYGGLK